MKTILKFRWLISIIVIIAVACAILFAPNLSKLASDNGNIVPPKDTTSQQYTEKLKDVGADSKVSVQSLNSIRNSIMTARKT